MVSRCGGGSYGSTGLVFPRRLDLVRLKCKALRCGVWFRVLSRVERSLVDLAIVTVSRIRSLVLARSLAFIVGKFSGVFGSGVLRQVQAVGFPLARRLSGIAMRWGNVSACGWAGDLGFARYLAICVVGVS